MMAKEPEVTLERFGSHSVSATQAGDEVDHEEVYGYFRTTWQGKPVAVTMEAKRYATRGLSRLEGLTWHEWRVFASECRYIDDEANGRRGEATTPTARTRLAEVVRPLMLAWLEGRMDFAVELTAGYAQSRAWAFRNLARNMLSDCRPWEDATRRVRAFLVKYAHELTPGDTAALLAACDAYDVFSEAFRAIN